MLWPGKVAILNGGTGNGAHEKCGDTHYPYVMDISLADLNLSESVYTSNKEVYPAFPNHKGKTCCAHNFLIFVHFALWLLLPHSEVDAAMESVLDYFSAYLSKRWGYLAL